MHCLRVAYFIAYSWHPITAFFWGLNGWYRILTHREILINPTVLLCYLLVKNVKNSAGSRRQLPLCCKYLVSGIISRANGLTDDCAGDRSSRGKEDKTPQPLQGLKVSSKDKGCLWFGQNPSDFYPVSLWGVVLPFWLFVFGHGLPVLTLNLPATDLWVWGAKLAFFFNDKKVFMKN